MGTTQQQVTRWETGKRDIRAHDVVKLSAILGVTVSYLLGVDQNGVSETLTDDESRLVRLYRSTDARGRETIMTVAESQSGEEGASEADGAEQAG